jgi:hypothetical protein
MTSPRVRDYKRRRCNLRLGRHVATCTGVDDARHAGRSREEGQALRRAREAADLAALKSRQAAAETPRARAQQARRRREMAQREPRPLSPFIPDAYPEIAGTPNHTEALGAGDKPPFSEHEMEGDKPSYRGGLAPTPRTAQIIYCSWCPATFADHRSLAEHNRAMRYAKHEQKGHRPPSRLVAEPAGIIPEPTWPEPPERRRLINEQRELIALEDLRRGEPNTWWDTHEVPLAYRESA